jgi:uncharacterized membrane protein
LTADLSLAGIACNVYGNDVQDLKLLVNYDSGNCSIFVFGQIYTRVKDFNTIATAEKDFNTTVTENKILIP